MNDLLGSMRTKSRRRPTFWVGLLAAAALLAACGDDSNDDSNGGGGSQPAGEETTSTGNGDGATGQPAVHEEAVTVVEGLIADYDRLTRTLLSGDDPTDDQLAELQALFTDDSPTLAQLLEEIDAADGNTRAEQYTRLYLPGATDQDTMTFHYCQVLETAPTSSQDTDSTAPEGSAGSGEIAFGRAEARRVDGHWRLGELTRDDWIVDPPADQLTAGCSDELIDDAIEIARGDDR